MISDTQKKRCIDLHTHTTASDGTCSPQELVHCAQAASIGVVAVTDHDSLAGVKPAMQAGKRCGVIVVPGIELSTEYRGCEVHVVGLFVDQDDAGLLAQAEAFRRQRDARNEQMVKRLAARGFVIDMDALYARFPNSVVARPHIARYLYESGQVGSIQTAFDRYIGDDRPCYVHRDMITPMEAVGFVHAAEGLAILAHPCLYQQLAGAPFSDMLQELCAAGLDGMEVHYSRNTKKDNRFYRALADQYGLLYSGGSDFHGANKPDIAIGTGKGDLFVPEEWFYRLENALGGGTKWQKSKR